MVESGKIQALPLAGGLGPVIPVRELEKRRKADGGISQ
jgi:hypothetical protein